MSRTEPAAFKWDGHVMVPMRLRAAERAYVVDRVYWMVETKDNKLGSPSWRHMWAVLGKAWDSLPEDLHGEYPDADALRKRALISAGYFDEVAIEVGDAATAGRMVTSLRRQNSFSHVRIQDGVVYQRTAKSQKEMDPETFEQSKSGIFEIIADSLGVTVDELTKQGD